MTQTATQITITAKRAIELTDDDKIFILFIKRSRFSYTNREDVIGWDVYDSDATHYLAMCDGRHVGYARSCKANTFISTHPSFSRVCVVKTMEGKGIAKQLIERITNDLYQQGEWYVKILVRERMIPYYEKLGFVILETSEPYEVMIAQLRTLKTNQ